MKRVLIDVGHGASTFPPGKGVYRSGKGYAEYDFNIKLARAIARLLEANGVGATVYPNDGRDVPLKQRTDYYNKENFDLVVSVHANANSNASVNGRCVFYWHSSANSRRLAIAVRDEIRNAGYSTHGSGLHESKVGSWTNLHIVRETRMPAVLIEHGFMTGNQDFELVFGNKQGEYIQDMAEADSKAILKYFGLSYTNEPVKGSEPIVTKDDNLYRVQVGAFSDKANAEKLAKELKDKGYPVYIPDSQEVTVSEPKPAPKPARKSVSAIAREVLDGKWGNNPERRQRLESVGYSYSAVRAEVNKLAGGSSKPVPSFTVNERVRVKPNAKTYATGQNIPSRIKGNVYTIQQVRSDRVLLKELVSWVRRSDVEKP